MHEIISNSDEIFGMANITPRKSGLSANIWSDHSGIKRNKPDVIPRVNISTNEYSVSVSIESNPTILADSGIMKKSDEIAINEARKYVGRNYDIFLSHYNDMDDTFDDEDLFNALRARGEYK